MTRPWVPFSSVRTCTPWMQTRCPAASVCPAVAELAPSALAGAGASSELAPAASDAAASARWRASASRASSRAAASPAASIAAASAAT
eukprot:scaffold129141_cov63-Phaeocystis_antarctica.AAC.2